MGRYERQPRIALSRSRWQRLAVEKRRELVTFILDVVAIAGFDAKRRALEAFKQRTELLNLHGQPTR
jgi:hypothetical protein